MSSFINYISDPEWGNYYELTKTGYYILVIFMVIALIVAGLIASGKQSVKDSKTKQLAFAGISLALAFVTSFIKFEMPMGGSITLFSMFFICYVGYIYGAKIGLITAFAYSLLQFMQTGANYFLTPFQTCCDYFFAFTALGISGLWYKKKNGLVIGYIFAIFLRGLFHTIGGYIYWMDYMPDTFPKNLAAIYPIVYNYSYILIEGIVTLIVINIPAVKKALTKIGENTAA
ncbi:MAG: energy-coupled thiamine transporter ThiT [Lachnospiraceae bacterium]|nr:energy-coupled thiamine transporter ThiT [Lachnospiraceae bacterium]